VSDSPGGGAEQSARHAARFRLGADVLARDGPCGELTRLIIDPVARALAHLVVTPKHHRRPGRLVPIELVEAAGDPVRLRCSTAEFQKLDEADDTQLVPASSDVWSYGGGQVYSWPHYGLGLAGGMGAGGMGDFEIGHHKTPQPIDADRVPLGEVEIRRGDQVHASDGWIGSVQGLVIDPGDHHVTHVLLAEGHLWGHKQVAIPIGAVSRMDDEVRVALSQAQVQDLPAVKLSSRP
jgi:hypothetical protein